MAHFYLHILSATSAVRTDGSMVAAIIPAPTPYAKSYGSAVIVPTDSMTALTPTAANVPAATAIRSLYDTDFSATFRAANPIANAAIIDDVTFPEWLITSIYVRIACNFHMDLEHSLVRPFALK